jgi:hypothetical protein
LEQQERDPRSGSCLGGAVRNLFAGDSEIPECEQSCLSQIREPLATPRQRIVSTLPPTPGIDPALPLLVAEEVTMKRKRSIIWTLVAIVASSTTAIAQPGPGPHMRGGGPGMRHAARIYDPKTVETVSGDVVRVEHVPSRRGMGGGVHLVLRTGDGTVAVHLGPAGYVERQDVKIAAGDRIQVKGSRVTVDGKPAIVAAEVKKGDQTLVLRDDAGIPKWSRGRRGARP